MEAIQKFGNGQKIFAMTFVNTKPSLANHPWPEELQKTLLTMYEFQKLINK